MISEASIVKSLIHLNVQQTKDLFLELCTGRYLGSAFFQLIVRPSRWYREMSDDLSSRSARKIRLHFQSKAEGKLESISRKVTEKICNEALFLELQNAVVKNLAADWIKGMHQSESRIAPAVTLAKQLIASSIESVRQYDDENPLKKLMVKKLINFIDRQFPVVLISNSETKLLVEVLVTHFFSSDPNRDENIQQAIASTVSYRVKPYVFENVKSATYDALPIIADCVEVLAKDNTHAISEWVVTELCSFLSSTGLAYAGASLLTDEEGSPTVVCGSVAIATMGLWALKWLRSSSSEIDIDELCTHLNDRYQQKLKRYFACTLADLHNRWTPTHLHRQSIDFIDSIPNELIENGVRLIAETVLSELKFIPR